MSLRINFLAAAAAATMLWATPTASFAQMGGPQAQQRSTETRTVIRERGPRSRVVVRERPSRVIIRRGESNCRTVVTRRVNRMGDTVVRRARVCR